MVNVNYNDVNEVILVSVLSTSTYFLAFIVLLLLLLKRYFYCSLGILTIKIPTGEKI